MLTACCVAALAASGSASAQQSDGAGAPDSREIRRSAESILSSPEFRHFKRLERGQSPFGTNGGGSMGSGGPGGGGSDGGSSSGGSGPGGGAGQEGASPRGGASSPSGGTPSSSSSTFSPVAAPAALGALLGGLAWLMLAAVAAVIVFLIVMAVKNYDGGVRTSELTDGGTELQGEVEPERPPGELPADVYLAEARKLAAAGQYREAIAQLLLGAMSYVERAGLIRYRRGLTQRDYLRTLRGERTQYDAMKTMVRVYEPLGFGRRTPAREHFQESVSGYEEAFRSGNPKSEIRNPKQIQNPKSEMSETPRLGGL